MPPVSTVGGDLPARCADYLPVPPSAYQDEDFRRLRELHADIDRANLGCYGWQDLDPGHRFYQNERGQTRYTVSPAVRREILRRLLELNLRIAAEAAAEKQGLAKLRANWVYREVVLA